MRGLTSVAAAAVLTLGLAGCGGGAGAHCGDFKNADKTIVAVQDGIAAGIASGKIKADEVAKKIADATPEGAKVPGGDVRSPASSTRAGGRLRHRAAQVE